jgi:hypothetical protein
MPRAIYLSDHPQQAEVRTQVGGGRSPQQAQDAILRFRHHQQ